jgi:hypothetical protein
MSYMLILDRICPWILELLYAEGNQASVLELLIQKVLHF